MRFEEIACLNITCQSAMSRGDSTLILMLIISIVASPIFRNNLAGHAPVDLVQEYFACKATVYDALFNSVGIASGNTATFVPILMLFLLPLIYIYLSSSGNLPPKKEYEEEVCE